MYRITAKLGRYDPKSYWEKRGKVFAKENPYSLHEYRKQEEEFVNYLNSIQFSSVLEFGCGYGRMSKIMLENFNLSRYVGIDISPDLVLAAKKNTGRFPSCRFENTTVQDFKSDEKFDLVFGIEVLQHIRPSELDTAVDRLVHLSNRHIINLDVYSKNAGSMAKHNFVHDYEKAYSDHPQISKVVTTDLTFFNQVLFHGIKAD
ncbi:MAG: class I SAM-dependent methyltransferase [Candidatus Nitrosotenuis sp.]|nr:class I SAM-dependent methyltransferase [Candidatus Nitrosotenuis sp.]